MSGSAFYDTCWATAWHDCCRLGPSLRHRNRLLCELVHDLPVQRLADVGCGNGETLAQVLACLRRTGTSVGTVMGMDASAEALTHAQRRLPSAEFVRGDIAEGPVGGAFDLVLCCDVLEHVLGDRRALGHLRAMTGGRLIVTTVQGPFRAADRALGHVRTYPRALLEARLRQAGFRVDAVVEWGWPFYSPLHRACLARWPRMTEGTFGVVRRALAAGLTSLFWLNSHRRGDLLVVRAT